MTEIEIQEPHGYLRDANGRVVTRFANWRLGTHNVPDSVESVEYVNGSNAHNESVADAYREQP